MSNKTEKYQELQQFCSTDQQKAVFDLLVSGMTQREVAEELCKDKRSIERCVARVKNAASLQGYAPENDMIHVAPDTHIVKGTSTLYKDGKPSLQWVKTNVKLQDQIEVAMEMVEALKEDVPQVKAVPKSDEEKYANAMAVYPMGDPHIGMLAWIEETGVNHDLNIGVTQLVAAMHRLVNTAPSCRQAVIVNLGDFYHSDFSDNKTWRSGNNLDVDGRWAKILRYGIHAMRTCIDSALQHHEHVVVINAIGNHDDHSSMFLSVCLDHMYEHEPRVTINTSPTSTHYVRFGKNLIGVHHGHTIKADKLPLVMATEQKENWGETEFRTWLTGHIHHDSLKEFTGCTVESFRTLAARDHYAVSHGYNSHRDMKCIVYDQEYGEIERHTVNIKRVNTDIELANFKV